MVIVDNEPDFEIPEIEYIEDIEGFNKICDKLREEYSYLFDAKQIGLL